MPRARVALPGVTTKGGGMGGSGEHKQFSVAVGGSQGWCEKIRGVWQGWKSMHHFRRKPEITEWGDYMGQV